MVGTIRVCQQFQVYVRRGYTPASLREFCRRIGVTKQDNVVEYSALEACIREDLNENAPRAMAVIDPVRVVIENFEGEEP